MILLSACLAGYCCQYSGGHNYHAGVMAYLRDKHYRVFCPECAGGLPTPRPPVELTQGRAVNREGDDVTAAFTSGAQRCLAFCRKHGITRAILKERSPSCGVHKIYDGSFSGRIIAGQGYSAALLRENGIEVLSEEDDLFCGKL